VLRTKDPTDDPAELDVLFCLLLMTFDGTCERERGGVQRAPQGTEKAPPASRTRKTANTTHLV
jgi:hypothetical protein